MPLTALTFGCRLNAAESAAMVLRAREAGLSDAILVNTCAVTAEAVRQARQAIRKARREHPEKRIFVSGCAAQIEPQTFAAMPEVDAVLGNAEKLSANAYRALAALASTEVAPSTNPLPLVGRGSPAGAVGEGGLGAGSLPQHLAPNTPHPAGPSLRSGPATLSPPEVGCSRLRHEGEVTRKHPGYGGEGFGVAASEKIRVSDIFAVRAHAPDMLDAYEAARTHEAGSHTNGGRTRAFLEVQNGCDHRCTFCIIPYGRGNSRSVPMGAVVEAVRRLVVKRSVKEVVLTGVDLTSYGSDLPGRPRLGKLVRAILRHVPELPRLRLSSIDSVEADAELLRALAEEERLMPHLHLSLQSGDDMILKRMKRRHGRADAIRFCDEVRERRPGIVLGADLIAGFPTETEAMFENTLSLIEACGLTLLHVFPFSPRQGTPAARMPRVAPERVQARARAARRAGHLQYLRRLRSEAGKAVSILVEKPGFGRTEHYLPAMIDHGAPGEIVSARIGGIGRNMLEAHAIREAA